MTTILTMDFLFFFSPSLDTENEYKSHTNFDHKNLIYVYHLHFFHFMKLIYNSHIRKIYFKAHINDNNESDLDLDNLN